MSDQLMSAEDLAANLGISVETVYRMCRTGKWPAAKIGRLYRFTPEHYETITAPPAPKKKPRGQRENIAQLLRSA